MPVGNPSYLPYVSQTAPLSIIICGTNLFKSAVLYCLADAPRHFTKGARDLHPSRDTVVSQIVIPQKAGHTGILLTGTNICHNIIYNLAHTLSQACRTECTWKPYVLSCLAMNLLHHNDHMYTVIDGSKCKNSRFGIEISTLLSFCIMHIDWMKSATSSVA